MHKINRTLQVNNWFTSVSHSKRMLSTPMGVDNQGQHGQMVTVFIDDHNEILANNHALPITNSQTDNRFTLYLVHLCSSIAVHLCLCVTGFICGVCFAIICSHLSFFWCFGKAVSGVWHILSIFTYISESVSARKIKFNISLQIQQTIN